MKPFAGKALSWNLSDGVIELAMHLPPANEIGTAMLAELDQFHLALQAASGEASVLIIYSQLKAGFSAGGDLREMYIRMRESTPTEISMGIRDSLARSHARLNAIDDSPLVTIAAVHGVCFGGGFELALTCDLIVADRMARFCFPELRLGLIPGGGGIPRLKRDVRNGIVRDLLLTGRSINADKALAAGLISEIAAENGALKLARSMATRIKGFDVAARIAAKRFIKPIPHDELHREIEIFSQLFCQPAVVEGLRKFVESAGALPYLP
jgi:enoyl-CoA hydratase/carnithine racemase